MNTLKLSPIDAQQYRRNNNYNDADYSDYNDYNSPQGQDRLSPQSPVLHDIFPGSSKLAPSRTDTRLATSIGGSLTSVLRGLEEMNDEAARVASSLNGQRPPPMMWEKDGVISNTRTRR